MRSSGITAPVLLLALASCEDVLDLRRPITIPDDASLEPEEAGRQEVQETGSDGARASFDGAGGGAEAGLEAGSDAGADEGTGTPGDAASADAGKDAGFPLYFGADCPTGTTYTDPFDYDPVASGNWTLVAGTYSFDAAKHTVTLVADSANTQMWIGPRPSWTNYTVSVPVTLNSPSGNGGINFRIEDVPDPAPNDSGHMYLAGMWPTGIELGAETGGDASAWKYLGGAAGTFDVMTSYVMQASVSGQTATVSINGVGLFMYTDDTFDLTYGSVGIHAYESTLTFGPVTVTCN